MDELIPSLRIRLDLAARYCHVSHVIGARGLQNDVSQLSPLSGSFDESFANHASGSAVLYFPLSLSRKPVQEMQHHEHLHLGYTSFRTSLTCFLSMRTRRCTDTRIHHRRDEVRNMFTAAKQNTHFDSAIRPWLSLIRPFDCEASCRLFLERCLLGSMSFTKQQHACEVSRSFSFSHQAVQGPKYITKTYLVSFLDSPCLLGKTLPLPLGC